MVCSGFSKLMVEISGFNLIVVNLFLIHGRLVIIKNWGISVMNRRVSCGAQPKRANGTYTKWVTGPEPVGFPSKPCRKMAFINEIKGMLCCNAYDLSIKISPVTPVSNKAEKFSDFPLILIIHREIKCLFETSTEFAGVKVNVEIKRRDGPCKRLDARITFFFGWVLVDFQLRVGPVVGGWV